MRSGARGPSKASIWILGLLLITLFSAQFLARPAVYKVVAASSASDAPRAPRRPCWAITARLPWEPSCWSPPAREPLRDTPVLALGIVQAGRKRAGQPRTRSRGVSHPLREFGAGQGRNRLERQDEPRNPAIPGCVLGRAVQGIRHYGRPGQPRRCSPDGRIRCRERLS